MTLSDLQRIDAEAAAQDVPLQMDQDAFRAFYDRTARPLRAYLSRITGDRQLADDLVQDSYFRFLRAARHYASDTHRRNSLFRIATNLAHDARRRARPAQLPEDHESSVADDVDLASRTEHRRDLQRAMARLRVRDRQLLWLAYAQGESHRDIAAMLGLKAGSIRLLLFRARRKLAAFLGARA